MIDNYISTDFTERELIGFQTLNEFYLNLRTSHRTKILTQTDIPKGKRLISIFTFVHMLGIKELFYHVVLDGDEVISICNLTSKVQYKEPSI